MLIFTLLAFGSTLSMVNGSMSSSVGMTSGLVFGFLLVISAFSLLLRGRA